MNKHGKLVQMYVIEYFTAGKISHLTACTVSLKYKNTVNAYGTSIVFPRQFFVEHVLLDVYQDIRSMVKFYN